MRVPPDDGLLKVELRPRLSQRAIIALHNPTILPEAVVRIDVHAHFYPEPYIARLAADPEFELSRDAVGNRVVRYGGTRVFTIPEPNRTPEERLAEMDAAGVDVQVLSLGTPNVYVADVDESRALAVSTNDLLAGLSRAHPIHFRALASLPLGDMDATLRELDRTIDQLGMDGVQLGTNFRGEFLDEPRFEPLLAELDRRSLPVLLHPVPRLDVSLGRDYALCMVMEFPVDTTRAVARLIYSGALDRFSRIRWILSHVGGTLPFIQGRMDFGHRLFPECQTPAEPPSAYLRRLYYDTVTSGYLAALECAIANLGASQLVFGTDCPHNPPGAFLDVLAASPSLDESARQAVLGGTALTLFPRLASAVRRRSPRRHGDTESAE
ncbi:MAG: amidohydrolase [Chloroflexi bacterium]|nr:amidohydrolase [Chloroflexota bacterium]